jgi:tight adherence protein B
MSPVAFMSPVVSALLFTATLLLVLALRGPIGTWFEGRQARARDMAFRLHVRPVPGFWVYGAPLVGLCTFGLLFVLGATLPGAVLGVMAYLLVEHQPRLKLRARHAKFDKQLSEALTTLANGLRSGMSLPSAVRQTVEDAPAPASQEFGRILREYELGKPIEQAFEDASTQLDNRNFELAVTAFRVGRERGGELAGVFENIADSIREIYRVEEKIQTASTQGRSSARFMSAMPGIFLFLLWIMDPEGVELLFSTGIGLVILTVVLVFNVVGHLWIRRLLNVDV